MSAAETTTELVYVPDHADVAVADLLHQDRDKPRLLALVRGLAAGVQELEDLAFPALVDGGVLDASSGAQLDQWGALVGEPRLGLGDDDYRRFIAARVLVNIGSGTVEDLLTVWGLVTGPSVVRYFLTPPAGYRLQAVRAAWLDPQVRRRVVRIMADASPAGVEYALVTSIPSPYGYGPDGAVYGLDVGTYARRIA